MSPRLPCLAAIALLPFGCTAADRTNPAETALGAPALVEAPVPVRSGEPFLATMRDGRLLLSWLEATSDTTHALRFATLAGGSWSPPRTVAQGSSWFVNWADFPSVVELPDGSLAAHYLRRSGPGTYAYDVWLTFSADGGATWTAPFRPHRDGTQTEHGFVTLFPHADSLGVVWLDGRGYEGAETSHGGPGGEMSLRYALVGADGGVSAEAALDPRTCDCCQTTVALTDAGPVVIYRDRSAEEIRDMSVVRLVDGAWTEPVALHEDGWRIDACPVNGPAAAARGRDVVVAWFTAAADTPRVNVAFSEDAGATFGVPLRIDGGAPAGRVAVALDGSGVAYVSWLENVGDEAEVRVRRVARDGAPGPPLTVAAASARRASGFPRLAVHADALWLAWTQPGDSARVQLARVPLGRPAE